jgi:hypothetical protein
MIRHKTVTPNVHAGFIAPFRHQLYVYPVVFFPEKRLLAAIAPLGNVVRISNRYHSSHSRHIGSCPH